MGFLISGSTGTYSPWLQASHIDQAWVRLTGSLTIQHKISLKKYKDCFIFIILNMPMSVYVHSYYTVKAFKQTRKKRKVNVIPIDHAVNCMRMRQPHTLDNLHSFLIGQAHTTNSARHANQILNHLK